MFPLCQHGTHDVSGVVVVSGRPAGMGLPSAVGAGETFHHGNVSSAEHVCIGFLLLLAPCQAARGPTVQSQQIAGLSRMYRRKTQMCLRALQEAPQRFSVSVREDR